MTIERAVALLQTGTRFPNISHTAEEVDEACKMAVLALRAQQEQPNEPLTLDDLREMELHQWVWIEVLQPFNYHDKVSAYYKKYLDYTHGKSFCCGYPGITFGFDCVDYGKTWLAYRAAMPLEKVQAPQEKNQREQECEYCDFSSGSCGAIFDGEDDFFLITPENLHEFYIATDGKGVFRETKIEFCPMCGRRLDGGGEDG